MPLNLVQFSLLDLIKPATPSLREPEIHCASLLMVLFRAPLPLMLIFYLHLEQKVRLRCCMYVMLASENCSNRNVDGCMNDDVSATMSITLGSLSPT